MYRFDDEEPEPEFDCEVCHDQGYTLDEDGHGVLCRCNAFLDIYDLEIEEA